MAPRVSCPPASRRGAAFCRSEGFPQQRSESGPSDGRSSLVTTRVSPARSECFAQAGSVAVGAGEAVVDVDAFDVDSEFGEPVALRGEVLFLGRHAGVSRSAVQT